MDLNEKVFPACENASHCQEKHFHSMSGVNVEKDSSYSVVKHASAKRQYYRNFRTIQRTYKSAAPANF